MCGEGGGGAPVCACTRVSLLKSMKSTADRFSKQYQISSFIKIRPVGAELFHADREKDRLTDRRDKAKSRFSHCCESA